MSESKQHAVETERATPVREPSASPPLKLSRRNGAAAEPAAAPTPRKNALRFPTNAATGKGHRIIAAFCYEPPGSAIGQYMAKLTASLAGRGQTVVLFTREPVEVPGVACHAVGGAADLDVVDAVHDFGARAADACREALPAGAQVTLLGHEWSALAAMVKLRLSDELPSVLLLSSTERQRSDLSSDLSKRIDELERAGLRDARTILVRNDATADALRQHVPECASRLAYLPEAFPTEPFAEPLDAGLVKARYQVGPVDPMILFIGDMDARHGIDVLMKSVPSVLKNHPQARFVFVGDGDLHWPMRVHARYLLLEHAVRFVGDVQGQALHDLVQAADVIAVPSREATEWWPVQVAWAAGRPVVVARPVAEAMGLAHEQNSVVIYPHESSCVWGLERVLFDPALRTTLADQGKAALEKRFGWGGVAEQVEQALGLTQLAAAGQ